MTQHLRLLIIVCLHLAPLLALLGPLPLQNATGQVWGQNTPVVQ